MEQQDNTPPEEKELTSSIMNKDLIGDSETDDPVEQPTPINNEQQAQQPQPIPMLSNSEYVMIEENSNLGFKFQAGSCQLNAKQLFEMLLYLKQNFYNEKKSKPNKKESYLG